MTKFSEMSKISWVTCARAVHCLGLVALLPLAHGFNAGAPLGVCVGMRPGVQPGSVGGGEGHVAPPQNVAPLYGNSRVAPYRIDVQGAASPPSGSQPGGGDWLEIRPGQSYQVSVVANQTSGRNIFKGLLLMAREVTCASNATIRVRDSPVGKFSVASDAVLTTLDCGGLPASAVTHNSPQYKIAETVTWTAPQDLKANVVFKATIVQSLTTYWVDVHSRVLHVPGFAALPARCGAPWERRPSLQLILAVSLLPYFAMFRRLV